MAAEYYPTANWLLRLPLDSDLEATLMKAMFIDRDFFHEGIEDLSKGFADIPVEVTQLLATVGLFEGFNFALHRNLPVQAVLLSSQLGRYRHQSAYKTRPLRGFDLRSRIA